MLVSTLDEYSRLLCYPLSPFFLLSGCCNQMVDPRSQMPPDDYYYYPEGAYYYVETADDQE